MSKKGVGFSWPAVRMEIRPPCSTTNKRLVASGLAVRKSGLVKACFTTGCSLIGLLREMGFVERLQLAGAQRMIPIQMIMTGRKKARRMRKDFKKRRFSLR